MNLKDRYLVYQTKRGNPEAYAKIYDKYLDKIYRFIFFRIDSQERAEDLSSQVFLKTLEYIGDQTRTIDNLQALLYQTARNLVIDFYRGKGKEVSLKVGDGRLEVRDEKNTTEDLIEGIDAKLDLKKIEKALRGIKDEYREVIILYYLEEMSVGEIARILGKKEGNVRVLVHRGLKALREWLSSRGATEPRTFEKSAGGGSDEGSRSMFSNRGYR
ncbi:MAG: RNA polymerase sigma factor [bacterium]